MQEQAPYIVKFTNKLIERGWSLITKKAMTGNARHGESSELSQRIIPMGGSKKSATINDSGIGCRGKLLLANDFNFDRNPLRGCNYGLEGVHF